MKYFKLFALTVFIILVFVIISTLYNDNYRIRLVENNLRVLDDATDDFYGLKIVQFSDTLFANGTDTKDIEFIANFINDTRPDILLFNGNLLKSDISNELKETIINELSRINTSVIKLAITSTDEPEQSIEILTESGFEILNDKVLPVYFGNNIQYINFLGFSGTENDIEIPNSDAPLFAVIHNPQIFNQLQEIGPKVVWAGGVHNHFNIPFTHLFRSGDRGYSAGMFNRGDQVLLINNGLGTDDLRLFSPRTINMYRLLDER